MTQAATRTVGGSLRALLLVVAAVIALPPPCAIAQALPMGGRYVAGSGHIGVTGQTMTINQSSQRGIINWHGFSIGAGGRVQFDNGTGATLNRVTGGSLSRIAGQLEATGSLYLVNPNGIVVGRDGRVLTGGSFVASTRDEPNVAFMAGKMQDFSGTSDGVVENAGRIVSTSGDVVLIGRTADNSGSIAAPGGTVGLAAGDRVLLRPADGPAGIYVVLDPGAKGNATNSGIIKAAAVALRSAGGSVYTLAGNRTGLIKAAGTRTIAGQVWLTAPGGAVAVAGTVEATNTNGSGGTILAKGKGLTLADGAVLDAAGMSGGGQIDTSGRKIVLGHATVNAGRGGTWAIDPTDLTVDAAAAGAIDIALNSGTNVLAQTSGSGAATGLGVQTAGGSGDIIVAAPIGWGSGSVLTLSAFNSVTIEAPITVTGTGAVVVTTNNKVGGASSGTGVLGFDLTPAGFLGSLQFTAATPSPSALTINGAAYTLVQNITELQAIGSSGNYALASSLDASGETGFIPIAENLPFNGVLEGLGNAVANLTINAESSEFVGLFGQINSGGAVKDLGLLGGSTSGSVTYPLLYVGALVGSNGGAISNAYATGAVSGSIGSRGYSYVGGLVGWNPGTISASHATGVVTGSGGSSSLGGLAGNSGGVITSSYATGAVNGELASGNGSGGSMSGGLVGENNGKILVSYATGNVNSGGNGGGLVGVNHSLGAISKSYATGGVSGNSFYGYGGLVGTNEGSIATSYAIGAVSGTLPSASVGGLVGANYSLVSESYATGSVSGGGLTGGLLGYNSGSVSDSDWDIVTSGLSSSAGGTGLTTAQLQTALPPGFDPTVWALNASINGGYPYLVANPPPGALVSPLPTPTPTPAPMPTPTPTSAPMPTQTPAPSTSTRPVTPSLTPGTIAWNGAYFTIPIDGIRSPAPLKESQVTWDDCLATVYAMIANWYMAYEGSSVRYKRVDYETPTRDALRTSVIGGPFIALVNVPKGVRLEDPNNNPDGHHPLGTLNKNLFPGPAEGNLQNLSQFPAIIGGMMSGKKSPRNRIPHFLLAIGRDPQNEDNIIANDPETGRQFELNNQGEVVGSLYDSSGTPKLEKPSKTPQLATFQAYGVVNVEAPSSSRVSNR